MLPELLLCFWLQLLSKVDIHHYCTFQEDDTHHRVLDFWLSMILRSEYISPRILSSLDNSLFKSSSYELTFKWQTFYTLCYVFNAKCLVPYTASITFGCNLDCILLSFCLSCFVTYFSALDVEICIIFCKCKAGAQLKRKSLKNDDTCTGNAIGWPWLFSWPIIIHPSSSTLKQLGGALKYAYTAYIYKDWCILSFLVN